MPGALIRYRRLQKGLSQRQAAEACHVATDTFSRWERGEILPSAIHRRQLAGQLGGQPGDYDGESGATLVRRHQDTMAQVRKRNLALIAQLTAEPREAS